MRETIEGLDAAKSVAKEIYAINNKIKQGHTGQHKKLLDAAWRLANLVMSLKAPEKTVPYIFSIIGDEVFIAKNPPHKEAEITICPESVFIIHKLPIEKAPLREPWKKQ